jgi:hypothetical protein
MARVVEPWNAERNDAERVEARCDLTRHFGSAALRLRVDRGTERAVSRLRLDPVGQRVHGSVVRTAERADARRDADEPHEERGEERAAANHES